MSLLHRSRFLTAFVLASVTVSACQKKEAKLETDQQKYSYAIGRDIGENLTRQNIELDGEAFTAGFLEAAAKKEARLSRDEMQKAMQSLHESRQKKTSEEKDENMKKGEAFLAENKTKDGIVTTDSGLQYKVVTEGKGDKPKRNDRVVVHYRGTLIDGTQFDSSYDRGTPAEFAVNQVIPGWTEALQLMPKGSKWELYIPANLAYGESSAGQIPPNSVLKFDVELIDIKRVN